MTDLPRALALSFAQLGDPRILAVLVKAVAVTLAVLAVFGAGIAYGIHWLVARYGFAAGDSVGAGVGVLLALLSGWVLFRVVALAAMQFFADAVVRAVEVKHYPREATQMRDLPLPEEVRQMWRGLTRALLFNALAAPVALLLLFTAIGPAVVFVFVNAILLGRELQDMVWLRHPDHSTKAQPIAGTTRFALGGVVAALLLVPFVGLIAPVVGAAAATHLVHRGAAKSTS